MAPIPKHVRVLAALWLSAGIASANSAGPGPTPSSCNASAAQAAVSGFGGRASTQIEQVRWLAASAGAAGPSAVPAHCEVTAVIGAHRGAPDNTAYGNHIRLRIPADWNGRLVFQGGGGNNGVLGDALGRLNNGSLALAQGHAVLAQDSGHQGRSAHFALDHQAYLDFAHAGVHQAALVGKAVLAALAGAPPHHAYFVGCSNGGREALVSAQRHDDFDGVVAGAPGLAVYSQWVQNLSVLQTVARVAGTPPGALPTDTSGAYSDAQLGAVADYFLARCDARDGLADGLVSHPTACTARDADYQALTCQAQGGASTQPDCLSALQADGLRQIHTGVVGKDGKLIYPGFIPGSIERALRGPYLGGGASAGVAGGALGGAPGTLGQFYDSIMPNLYFMGYGFRGYPGLTGPADLLSSYPASAVAYVAGFDVNTEPAKLAAGRLDFHGANIDPGQSGPNFEAFKRRGGKMLLYSGLADQGVQARGLMGWMDSLSAHYGAAAAADLAALFMVPGMGHCRGGNSTDQFDPLAPLVAWVEQGQRPRQLLAHAAPGSALAQSFPGVQRPLCAYPAYARYKGSGSPARADSFVCTAD